MTGTPPETYLRWMTDGHEYFLARLQRLDDVELERPSRLPGWNGRHLLSHIGHNARALARLAHWAATGERTPMYPGPEARDTEIESGARWETARLRAFVVEEQQHLDTALGKVTADRRQAGVVTAQGRTIPASSIPWLRSREVWIHAYDLPGDGDFADFPADFLDALIEDVVSRRRAAPPTSALEVRATDRGTASDHDRTSDGRRVEGSAADLARWLTRGAPATGLHTVSGAPVPALPAWL
ncbi:maleylpyruvate isomerase family mycothiol-dependent enzyme [Streptomyces cadmiisoli]|uniref:Maleylpyruvate isomerase n=1 Tax=Streptomyces cadmiisoli TaxID=2184053 RepID=A0A2Z4J8S6_9ACTN|nr:maleylpyruvate isomerase family mycothiol-dependent enzyme [Streptomyces cadmiisoli]AWW41564.1 maleylpyruvate isomerase [Streptomyces cadmiisoli]